MYNIFFIADTHFYHTNICKFLREDGSKLRPWDDVYEMNEVIVNNWNSVVKPEDKVYHLGDVASKSDRLEILNRLNGIKVLIKGNHDNLKPSKYLQYFKDIRGSHTIDKFLLTHIPIHPDSIGRWKANIHGHVHYRNLLDKRYFNVSVENINYTPIAFEEIKKRY